MFCSASLLHFDVETFGRNWRESDIKTSNMTSERHNDIMHESSLTPPHTGFTESPVRYARKYFSELIAIQKNIIIKCLL